jgi:hypothetical protein
MPRRDGNTPHKKTRHHKKMNSGSKGHGHSAKVRALKRKALAPAGFTVKKRKREE